MCFNNPIVYIQKLVSCSNAYIHVLTYHHVKYWEASMQFSRNSQYKIVTVKSIVMVKRSNLGKKHSSAQIYVLTNHHVIFWESAMQYLQVMSQTISFSPNSILANSNPSTPWLDIAIAPFSPGHTPKSWGVVVQYISTKRKSS